MAAFSPPSDQDGVIPLFALAPKGSDIYSGAVDTVNVAGQRAPVLRRTEFGYDIRLEGEGAVLPPRAYSEHSPWRRLGLIAFILLVLGGVVGFTVSQPAVRSGLAGLFNHSSSAPDPASAAPVAVATPTDVPTPSPTAAATPSPSATAAPTPPPAPSGPTPVTLTFNGSFTTSSDGSASTSCDSAQTGRGTCAWTITVQPGNALYVDVDWSGGAGISMKLLAPNGSVLAAPGDTSGHLQATLATPPATVRVIVSVTSGSDVKFTLTVANHQ